MKTLHTEAKALTKRLLAFERCGRYEEALAELRHIWEDTSLLPTTDSFEPQMAAEIILRCGSLMGFLGHTKQLPNAQEKSKNLLTEARCRFLDIYNIEKIAECENYLALAYWRTGELNEAKTWVGESLSHNLQNINNIRLYAQIIKCLILLSNYKYAEIISLLKPLESCFITFGDNCLKGDFYNHCGIAYQELGKTSEALKEFELARYYHHKSRHQIYLGTVENNLAQLYKTENKFAEAHEAIGRATKIFKQIKDKTREGFSLDTKARIYFTERKYTDALKTIEKAIKILGKSENAAYLIETYLTKVKILIHLDDFSSATLCLSDAVQIAKNQISETAALNLIKEFEFTLEEKNSQRAKENSPERESNAEDLQLVLPPSIAHYQEIQVIRIQNTHLEDVGLKRGSLAVVINEKVKRGDLTAICETETDSVSCGFYDSEFGIICLDSINSEPQLFDEEKVKILGKIVGVCSSEKDTNGKILVELINT